MSAKPSGQVESNSCSHSLGGLPIPGNKLFRRPIPWRRSYFWRWQFTGPLLVMQLAPEHFLRRELSHLLRFPLRSSTGSIPGNEKWLLVSRRPPILAGHQWIALFLCIGLKMAYMLVQFDRVLLLPSGFTVLRAYGWMTSQQLCGGVQRLFRSRWVPGVFGWTVIPMLSAPLYLLAVPYFYDWSRNGEGRALLKGVILTLAAASVHHVTCCSARCYSPCRWLWLACLDRKEGRSVFPVIARAEYSRCWPESESE